MLTLLVFPAVFLVTLLVTLLGAVVLACAMGRPDIAEWILKTAAPYFAWLRIGGR